VFASLPTGLATQTLFAEDQKTPAAEKGEKDEPGDKTIDAKDPRARPLVYILIASHDSDLDLFKFAFSTRIREKVGAKEWPRGLAVYQRQLKSQLGDYTLGDLAKLKFHFEGNETEGRIAVVDKKGNSDAKLRVLKVDGVWKINER